MSSQILDNLNDVQREAVKYCEGPVIVIAGAGSGKTRLLTYKIAYLIEQGISPHSILALTFTNKAANEMKERIASIVGQSEATSLWMGTFHSIFSKILRFEAALLGYSSNYSIYDTTDSRSVLKSVIKELNLNPENYKINDIYSRISRAKNDLITPASYRSSAEFLEKDRIYNIPQFVDVYQAYTLHCKKADAMDFDDLLLNTNILFRDFPEVLEKYQNHFEYILVDEYQDTNFAQYYIIKKLAQSKKNICVVGDDAQSIYSFRGARIENILNFVTDYPEHSMFKLEQNYRSTQTIVNAANSVIAKNRQQYSKTIFSKQDVGEPIKIIELNTDQEEGYLVANEIFNTAQTMQVKYNNFAVLYRTNVQSRIFEEALRKRNIPYKLYGATSFYQRKEIKDILAYLRILANSKDDEALKRIINYPARGIGNSTIDKIEACAAQFQKSMWEIISNPTQYELDISSGILSKIQNFKDSIEEFQNRLLTENAYDLAMDVIKKFNIIEDLNSEISNENISRIEHIEELLNSIKEFVDNSNPESASIVDYLSSVSLLSDIDREDDKDNKDKVSLMTIHAAKGMEFDYVFIVGMEEGLFPSLLSNSSPEELEEERRLFYVAITRAKRRVMLTYAKNRYKYGRPTISSPSRYIFEIDPKYIDFKQPKNNMQSRPIETNINELRHQSKNNADLIQNQINTALLLQKKRLVDINTSYKKSVSVENCETDVEVSGLKQGMRVAHQQFGEGTVVSIEGVQPNHKAIVNFDKFGEKKLLLKFARLKIIQ
jgi:DNA helicase-2/ATP-dependent DNA helicase PcrA